MASARSMKLAGRRVAEVLDASVRPSTPAELDTRVEALRQLRKERSIRMRRARIAIVGALAACLALALVFLARPDDLSFSIDGGKGEIGKWIAAPPDGATNIAFSDGSSLKLHASGRARVAEVTDRGARVLLEDGTVTAAVVHREKTSWEISAGPFEVHIVGTTFDATWSASEEALTITMVEGRVEVTGACLDAPKPIEGTEAVRLSCRGVTSAVQPGPVASASATSESPAPTIATAFVPEPASSSASAASSIAMPSWRDLAKRGEYKDALRAAERDGALERAASSPASEIQELADIARLAGRADVARRLYASIRESSPGTDAAALAAFQLGRMTFGASASESERWFRTYLGERPGGSLAAEALGRILEIEQRRGDASAKQTAKRYLDQFPKGAHAALARSILEP